MSRTLHHARPCLLAAAGLVLSGCVTAYHHPAGVATAQVQISDLSQPQLCQNGHLHGLTPDVNGYADIPAGARIGIRSAASGSNGLVTVFCASALSFVPQPGQRYALIESLRYDRCRLAVYQEVPDTPTGLAMEASSRPMGVCSESGL